MDTLSISCTTTLPAGSETQGLGLTLFLRISMDGILGALQTVKIAIENGYL